MSNDLRSYFQHNQGRLIFKWNHYFDIYERHFAAFRNKPVKMLEIGVYHGGSLQMWKNYFGKQATIVGLDIRPACKAYEEEQIHVVIGNQDDKDGLCGLNKSYGPFDIILDDGSHNVLHQTGTFEVLFPVLKSDGIYMIEDTHSSYMAEFKARNQGESLVDYTHNLVDEMHNQFSRRPASSIALEIDFIAYYNSIIVIQKRNPVPICCSAIGTESFEDPAIASYKGKSVTYQ